MLDKKQMLYQITIPKNWRKKSKHAFEDISKEWNLC